ncbi:hypothetical protein M2165_002511 [Variovorax sp. TBS-050B]|uniref:phospholipase D-like domain-containing protein n=1 Tax=Variovorax sp. TBS-050B TaxID=2940551 RepID=UPI0024767E2E|nr:phospholipase D-like domain-containing protein [Variovorax sp. TBS-050B]MDH6592622.1 hypothetical protein [Variovorax sp. TBS-050B]
MTDNEVLLKRALRVFRNGMVQHIRERLNDKFAEKAEEQLASLFGKKDPESGLTQWERMTINAERARASLEVSTVVMDGYELLGVSDFFGVFEKFHDALTLSPPADMPPQAAGERKKGLLRCLQQVKVFRDPNAHDVTESISHDSLLLCLINCKLVCGEVGLASTQQALDELHKEIAAASVAKHATVVRVTDETSAYDLGLRCLTLSGASMDVRDFSSFEPGAFGASIASSQNCVIIAAAATPGQLSESEIDALGEALIGCDKGGQLPIVLVAQDLTEAHIEGALVPLAAAVFKRSERLPLVPAYAEATAGKLSRLMKSGLPVRPRPAPVQPVSAARAVHDDKLAPMVFSMMKDPQLVTARIVAPFATDMSYGALGPISTAMIEARKRGCRVCLVTRPPSPKDDDLAAKKHLLQLLHSEDIELYVNPRLHSKVYLFEREAQRHFWAVGSHNFTNLAHNGKSLETSMVGYRAQEFEEAQTSFERARRHVDTLNFDTWASQQMRADNQSQ